MADNKKFEYYLYSSAYASEANKEIVRRIDDNWSISNAPFQMSNGANTIKYAILFEREIKQKNKTKKGF